MSRISSAIERLVDRVLLALNRRILRAAFREFEREQERTTRNLERFVREQREAAEEADTQRYERKRKHAEEQIVVLQQVEKSKHGSN